MFQPILMKNVDLVLGDESTGTNFKCQLRSVQLTPDTQIQKLKTLCPDGTYGDVDQAEWNLELGYAYGRDVPAGSTPATVILADFLMANHGAKVPFEFRPVSGGPGYGGTVTLVAGPVGGSQGAWMEGTVTLPLDGQPTAVAA